MVDDSLMELGGMKIRHGFSGKFIQKGILQIVFTPKERGILYTQYTYLSPILMEYCVFDSCLATSIHPFLDKFT
jgi:hypothetical protein